MAARKSHVYSETGLANEIKTQLTEYQSLLVQKSHFTALGEQETEPSLILCFDDLRTLTGRQRLRRAFIQRFIGHLTDLDLEVFYVRGEETMCITKRIDHAPVVFLSLGDLRDQISDIQGELDL